MKTTTPYRPLTAIRAFLSILAICCLLNCCQAHDLEKNSQHDSDHKSPLVGRRTNGGSEQDGLNDANQGIIGYDSELGLPPVYPAITRRQDGTITSLKNNFPAQETISPGDEHYWEFPLSELHSPPFTEVPLVPSIPGRPSMSEGTNHLELRKREDVELHITLAVCTQPSPSSSDIRTPPPQLYFSISFTNPRPRTGGKGSDFDVDVNNGFGTYSTKMSGPLHIAVAAPSDPSFTGSWTYDLTGSIDAKFHDYDNSSALHFVDSDTGAGLFVSGNLSERGDPTERSMWMNIGTPFSIFVHNANDTQLSGLERSYCGLKSYSQVTGNVKRAAEDGTEVGMIDIGNGGPVQKFLVPGLNKSSSYRAFIGLETRYQDAGQGVPGGGGIVWKPIDFATKSDDNCQVIHGLNFCSDVNYAVPSNPANTSSDLARYYDDMARSYFTNFSRSLQQIPCNTTPDAQYSLAVNCSTCEEAYKKWLCAVTIPRCMDFSSLKPYLHARNVAQDFLNGTKVSSLTDPTFSEFNRKTRYFGSSRNPDIDLNVRPGPYKEVLPCGSLCHKLVQSCPAALQFACPLDGKGFNHSYGVRGMDGNTPMCNNPGSLWGVSGGNRNIGSISFLITAVAVSSILLA